MSTATTPDRAQDRAQDSAGPGVKSPAARRPVSSSWRDPRLVLGIALVAVSVLLGARIFAAADDSVEVWAVRADLRAGTAVDSADLVRRSIRFADADAADRYLAASSPLPSGSRLLRAVGSGELLPRAALGSGPEASLVEVPVAVPAELVPATVRVGSVVDVWVTRQADEVDADARSVLVFDDVVVLAAPRSGSALGPSATRQVIIGIDADKQEDLGTALALASSGTVVITRQG